MAACPALNCSVSAYTAMLKFWRSSKPTLSSVQKKIFHIEKLGGRNFIFGKMSTSFRFFMKITTLCCSVRQGFLQNNSSFGINHVKASKCVLDHSKGSFLKNYIEMLFKSCYYVILIDCVATKKSFIFILNIIVIYFNNIIIFYFKRSYLIFNIN